MNYEIPEDIVKLKENIPLSIPLSIHMNKQQIITQASRYMSNLK